jgi:hypothetical protein
MRTIRSLAASASVIAFVLAGCSSDGITASRESSFDTLGLSASRSVAKPWKGTCDVAASFTSATTLSILGTCQLAHLGRATVSATQTIEVLTSGLIAYTNTAVYTAANGDELQTSNVGIATPSAAGLALSGTETATGGTGRFANANGTAALTGAVAFTSASTTIGSYSLEGKLNY